MNLRKLLLFTLCVWTVTGCTKLDQDLQGEITDDQLGASSDAAALLKGVYNSMRMPYQELSRFWALQEHTTDEVIGPTRGGDWDDNGVWRVLHNHKWDANHQYITNTYTNLGQVVFFGTDLLRFSPSAQQAAEGRFLRAFAMFSMVDGWNQVPYREPGENLLLPPKVRIGTEALDYIISELNEIIPALPDAPQAYVANKNAARVLLMKCYLNKGTIANRAAPAFDAADMNQVITLADVIINTAKYTLADNYFDNFAATNDIKSKELIFTSQNSHEEAGAVRTRWRMGLHYNNNPSGWNGFTTLSDFYDKFEASDKRRGDAYPGVTDKTGLRVGFLVGQQFNQDGVAIKDRKGNPLSFTREVKLLETGNNLEVTGIRVMKYPPDYNPDKILTDPANSDYSNSENDYVFFRYADVLLMKAEALLRTGNAAAGLVLVNTVRQKRGASTLGALTLDVMLDERGREFYWEGWRRQDLIRFGKFLQAWQEKPESGPERLLFPIPNQQIAVNPNLQQNPGYNQ